MIGTADVLHLIAAGQLRDVSQTTQLEERHGTRMDKSTNLVLETGIFEYTGTFSYVLGDLWTRFIIRSRKGERDAARARTNRGVMTGADWDEAKVLNDVLVRERKNALL